MNSQAFSAPLGPSPSLRELQVAREIAGAFLTATRPSEVYRLALQQLAPLVGAAFACVFLREPEEELLRVVAAHNWPARYAAFLGALRVRVGNGPTGQAVAENRMVEATDVFSDPLLADWREVASELGFKASVSLPLAFGGRPAGALTFYFREPAAVREADRSLLRLVADQLAATAEKAHLIEDLQRANLRLREQNVELEARYRQAEEARRLKNEFLANVSHELRTPLTAVLGYTYLLREGLPGALSAEQAESVERIEAAASTLLRLINDLLDLTHLTLGRTTVEPEPCDAAALARAALAAVHPPESGVTVETRLPAGPVPVATDPTHVLRILQNLLSNAFKFTESGTVTLAVRAAGEAPPLEGPAAAPAVRGPVVIWEVEDTGIGIAPENQEVVFDEFRQVDGSPTRRFGGTGMGLALARGIARRLGGDIRLRSVLGAGSSFSLILPAALAAGAEPPRFEFGDAAEAGE